MGKDLSEGLRRLGNVSIALYRRYRPESFQEVIGQDHVTRPLMAALEAGRTTHAYLFSGPRGCGKTTSARILARCLNCVEYPTAKPCGKCDSCKELARDGSGSLDVVELDAASHGGVDDARELREQAGFAPVRDRFKIFIIDEAHMVTNQGFNALLKLVEEPPPHVKFIFATTEPEKVIGTIRSRTHHYPFRLVPPLELEKYLALVCAREGVSAGKDLLSLVVRAGTGSVRDTLSVLDQIIGGSEGTRLDYDRAVALLGYTSAALLDDAVDAISARDGAALFGVVDKVVKSGHDPRRFVEDMLQRLRDLVIIALAGDEAKDVFVSVPKDLYARMVEQAAALGAQRASQCADLTNAALSEMAGATAPRLQLELLCARLVIARVGTPAQMVDSGPEAPSPEVASTLAQFRTTPSVAQHAGQQVRSQVPQQAGRQEQVARDAGQRADREAGQPQAGNTESGGQAPAAQRLQGSAVQGSAPQGMLRSVEQQRRLDQMDPRRRPMPAMPNIGQDDGPSAQPAAGSQQAHAEPPAQQQVHAEPPAVQDRTQQTPRRSPDHAADQRASQQPHGQMRGQRPAAHDHKQPAPEQEAQAQSAASVGQVGGDPLTQIVAQWPAIVVDQSLSRIANAQLSAASGPVRVEGGVLYVGFEQPGVAAAFTARGARDLERILAKMLGLTLRVEGVAGGEPPAPKADAAQAAAPHPQAAVPTQAAHARQVDGAAPAGQPAEEFEPTQRAHLDAVPAGTEPAQPEGDPIPAAPAESAKAAPAPPVNPVPPGGSEWAEESPLDDEPYLDEPDPAHDPSFSAEPPLPPEAPHGSAHMRGANPLGVNGGDAGSDQRSAGDILGSAAESFPMPPPAELPEALASTAGADTSEHDPAGGFAQFPVPPVEDPYTHTTLGTWAQPSSFLRTPDGPDPDDVPDAEHTDRVRFPGLAHAFAGARNLAETDQPAPEDDTEGDPDWEGASADDPDISQSTMVGLQVLIERFDAKVIEEREEE